MRRCPLCERVWPLTNHQASPLWQKILHYADGQRGYKEIAELAGAPLAAVVAYAGQMRQLGIDVKIRPRDPKYVPTREDYELFKRLRLAGWGYTRIGRKIGLSYTRTYNRAQMLSEAFGELPGRVHRNRTATAARDFVRMDELRAGAGLPWRMIGKSMGLHAQAARVYYNELCKVYKVAGG